MFLHRFLPVRLLGVLWLAIAPLGFQAIAAPAHVLVISVDGMHAFDLANYVKANPSSTMAKLVAGGFNYTAAAAVKPADSFPGGVALFTGGTPASTGIYYDLSYDRSLWPPGATSGPTGTAVTFDETADLNYTLLNGGGGLNPNALARDPARGGALVYPHNYLRVNTVFEVVKAAGGRTAWSDKHLSDEWVLGPSGQGVDDLYLLEIAASNSSGVVYTKSVDATKAYDDLKVQAVLNEIAGYDHTGNSNVGVPAVFGLNFQAVSVAQKIKKNKTATGGTPSGAAAGPGGYLDGAGTPSYLVNDALNHTDASLGRLVAALQSQGLLDSTYIILTSKHGQAPVDPTKLTLVDPTIIPGLVEPITHVLRCTSDDSALLWLANQSLTASAANALLANQTNASIQDVWFGESLKLRYPDPLTDPRTPDIIALSKPGTIYTTSSKLAEHGGFTDQDLNVPLVIANPRLPAQTIRTPVQTTQIAPTILQLLGLNPFALQAVVIEKTRVLPGLDAAELVLNPALAATLAITNAPVIQVGNGQAQFTVAAHLTQRFVVQSSGDLSLWNNIATNQLSLDAALPVTDPAAGNYTNRFYRVLPTP